MLSKTTVGSVPLCSAIHVQLRKKLHFVHLFNLCCPPYQRNVINSYVDWTFRTYAYFRSTQTPTQNLKNGLLIYGLYEIYAAYNMRMRYRFNFFNFKNPSKTKLSWVLASFPKFLEIHPEHFKNSFLSSHNELKWQNRLQLDGSMSRLQTSL